MECQVVRLAFRLRGSNWHLSAVKHECAYVCPQHLTGQVLPEMKNVLGNSVSASEGRPVLHIFVFKCIVSLTVVVYYRVRAVSSREESSDKPF